MGPTIVALAAVWLAVVAGIVALGFTIRSERRLRARRPRWEPEPPLVAALLIAPDTVASTAVATVVLDLATRGFLDIAAGPSGARHGFDALVRWTGQPADSALRPHEQAVLDAVARRTAAGPLPPEALFVEMEPTTARWRDAVVKDAVRSAERHRPPYRRRLRRLTLAGLALSLSIAILGGLWSAQRWTRPSEATDYTINSAFEAWFFTFVWVVLIALAVLFPLHSRVSNEDTRRREESWRQVEDDLRADPELHAATPAEAGRLGARLAYAAAMGLAPRAVTPFTLQDLPPTMAWSAHGDVPRLLVIEAPADPPPASTDEEVVGPVLRSGHDGAGVPWIALDEGRSDRTWARPLEQLSEPAPARDSLLRLVRRPGSVRWSAVVLAAAGERRVLGTPPRPADLVTLADLERLFPGARIESVPGATPATHLSRMREGGRPRAGVLVTVWSDRTARASLRMAPHRRLQLPGEVYLVRRRRVLVVTEQVGVAVDITGRRITDRRAKLDSLAWAVSARLGVAVGNPPLP